MGFVPIAPVERRSMKIFISILIVLCLGGCCHMDKETKTLYGFGRFKDADIEMECNSPLKSVFSGINQ